MTLLLCMLSLNENGECLKILKLLELMENEKPALGLMSYIHIAIRALLVLEIQRMSRSPCYPIVSPICLP